MITFYDYLRCSAAAKADHPEWRMGQTYFNVLHSVNPELANKFRGTAFDPFFNDKNIGVFLKLVVEGWS